MKKLVLGLTAAALLAVPATASASSANAADGRCVSKGVQTLGGKGLKLISAAATGGIIPNTNAVPIVINDHLRNGADVTEGIASGLLGGQVVICP